MSPEEHARINGWDKEPLPVIPAYDFEIDPYPIEIEEDDYES